MLRFLSAARRQTGFSLTEMAIVLGIVGIVLSAIWTTRNIVAEKQRVDVAVTGIRETAENVRALYTGQSTFTYPTTTSAKICAGLYAKSFVVDARQSSGQMTDCTTWSVINPWGGDVLLGFHDNDGGTFSYAHAFTIAIMPVSGGFLPTSVCAELADRLAGTDTRTGLGSPSTSHGVPFPSPLIPANQPAQGGQPTNVFVSASSGSWLDATNQGPAWIADKVKNKCYGVAFSFVF